MNMKYIIKILISFGVLYVLFLSIDIETLSRMLMGADIALITIAFGFVLAIRFIMAYRWQVVLFFYGIFPNYFNILSIIFISNSIGHLLPAGVGVDVVRSYHLSKDGGGISDIAASVFIDRVIGLLSMISVALIASIFGYFVHDLSAIYSVLTVVALIALFALYMMRGLLLTIQYDKYIKYERFKFLFNALNKFATSLNDTRLPHSAIIKLFFLSVTVQMVRIAIFYIMILTFNIDIKFTLLMVFIPLLFIVMLMPISIGGLGVRESALYLFLAQYGISIEACTAVGLTFHMLQIVSLLPGLVLFLLRK